MRVLNQFDEKSAVILVFDLFGQAVKASLVRDPLCDIG